MNMSWETETGHLVCQWFLEKERVPYRPSWMQTSGSGVSKKPFVSPVPDYNKISPFGSNWYVLEPRCPPQCPSGRSSPGSATAGTAPAG